jgi:hyperosmotically inducible protein
MKKRIAPALVALAVSAVMFQGAAAQTAPRPLADTPAPTDKPADNTANNKADPSNAVTADAQKNDSTDEGLTQRIRQSVMADKTLSTYAHNVKIVAVGGTVTLNGVVRSDEEKRRVAAMAEKVAGKTHVVNDLKVAPPTS